MRILWVSPRWSLPADTGAKKATLALLEELVPAGKELGLDIQLDLLNLYEDEASLKTSAELESRIQCKDHLYLKKAPLVFGSTGLTYLLERIKSPKMPFTFARCTSSVIENEIAKWSVNKKWDYTIIDGLHAAAFIDLDDSRYGKFIYRSHNVEADLWKQLIAKQTNPLKKAAIRREYELCKAYEIHVSQKSVQVLTVSELDAQRFRDLDFSQQVQSLPIGISFKGTPLAMPAKSSKLQLLFVGRLDWLPNKEGLIWFLKEVWPNLSNRDRLHLTIIGSGDSEYLNSAIAPDVELLRNVPDLKPYYARCHLTLIPLFMGSGTRVKAIESGCYGRSFLSTAIGVEGLPFAPNEDYFRAETKSEWIRILNDLSEEAAINKASRIYEITARNFEQKNLAVKMLQIISKLS